MSQLAARDPVMGAKTCTKPLSALATVGVAYVAFGAPGTYK